MKNFVRITFILLLLLSFSSCTQYRFFPVIPPADDSTPYDVSTPEAFEEMLNTSGQARLTSDIEISTLSFGAESPVARSIDLNGKTLSISDTAGLVVKNGSQLTIRDGNIETSMEGLENIAKCAVSVLGSSSVVFDNVEYHSAGSGVFVYNDNSSFVATDSTIIADGAYGVGTNASNPQRNVSITLDNTDVTSGYIAVFFNVQGNLNIFDSIITSGQVAVLARCGTANISNSHIHSTGSMPGTEDPGYCFEADKWGGGNAVAYAALTIGNGKGEAYDFDATVTLSSTEVEMDVTQGVNDDACRIFVASTNNMTGKFITDNEDYIAEIKENKHSKWIGPKTYVQLEGGEEEHLV